jgi:3-oxosteroid 1-dehydrogenase
VSNRALAQQIDKLPDLRSWYPSTHLGEGLLMAAKIGASIAIVRNYLNVALGYPDPTDPDGTRAGLPSVRDLPRAHSMIVNRAGRRFGNEASFQELAAHFREVDIVHRRLKNLPCWMIFDSQFPAATGFAGSAPGTVPDWVDSAPSLDELASRIGVDPRGLEATVARFNGFAETGVDADFGRKPGWALSPGLGTGPNPNIGAIASAPFYAVKMLPTTASGSGGLKTDAAGRALDWSGTPIAGLHAVGDVATHDEMGIGYQSGVTFSSTLTFALLAAEDIAGAA